MTGMTPLQSKQTEESTAQINGHSCNIGVDVGTGSARVCIINHEGDILGYAAEDIHQWQSEEQDFNVSSRIIFRALKAEIAVGAILKRYLAQCVQGR